MYSESGAPSEEYPQITHMERAFGRIRAEIESFDLRDAAALAAAMKAAELAVDEAVAPYATSPIALNAAEGLKEELRKKLATRGSRRPTL